MHRDRVKRADDSPMPRLGPLNVYEAYFKKRERDQNRELDTPSTSAKSSDTEEIESLRSGTESDVSVEVLDSLAETVTVEQDSDGDSFLEDGHTESLAPLNSTLLPGALPVHALDPPCMPCPVSHPTPPEPPDETVTFRPEQGSPTLAAPEFERTPVPVPLPYDSKTSFRENDNREKSGAPRSQSKRKSADSRDLVDKIRRSLTSALRNRSTVIEDSRQRSGCERRSAAEEGSQEAGSEGPSVPRNGSQSEATTPQSGGKNPQEDRAPAGSRAADRSTDGKNSFVGRRAEVSQTGFTGSSVEKNGTQGETSKRHLGPSATTDIVLDKSGTITHRISVSPRKKRASQSLGTTGIARSSEGEKTLKSRHSETSDDDDSYASSAELSEPERTFLCPEHVPQDVLEIILERFQKRASK